MTTEESTVSINISKLKEQFLECGVCFQEYDEDTHHPRLLPCLHSFCLSCLEKILKYNTLKCPICLSEHETPNNDISIFRKDNTRRDLLDFVRVKNAPSKITCECCVDENQASYRCKECCEFLCDDCFISHRKARKSTSHEVFSLKNLKYSREEMVYFNHQSTCSIHNEILKFYCESEQCQKPICTACAITQHKESGGHYVRDIQEVYNEIRGDMDVLSEDLEQKKQSINDVIENINSEEICKKQDSLDITEKIEKDLEKCIEHLKIRKQRLLKDVKDIEKRKLKILYTQRESLEAVKEDIQQSCQVLRQTRLTNNAPAFLQVLPVIRNRLFQLKDMALETEIDAESGAKYLQVQFDEKFDRFVDTIGTVSSDPVQSVKFRVECEDRIQANKALIIGVVLQKYNKRYFMKNDMIVSVQLTCPGFEGPKVAASRNGDRFMAIVKSHQVGRHAVIVYVNNIAVEYDTKFINVYLEGQAVYEELEENIQKDDKYQVPDVCLVDITQYSGRFISMDRTLLSNLRHEAETPFPHTLGIASTSITDKDKVYLECKVQYSLNHQECGSVFEIGFVPESSVNLENFPLKPSWSLEGIVCEQCNGVGIHSKYNGEILQHHYILSSFDKNVSVSRLFAFLLDGPSRVIYLLDKTSKRTIFMLEFVDFSVPIRPFIKVCDVNHAQASVTIVQRDDIKSQTC